MKINISKYAACFAMAALLTAAIDATGGNSSAANIYLPVLSAATQAELPAKASELVSQATDKNRRQTTIDVVRAAVGLNPAAAPAIVGAIAQTSPEMAAVAAVTAIGLVPDQVVVIARAAAAAAPAKAGEIVKAICRVFPEQYQSVAEAVAQVVPTAAKEILAGVSEAIPALKGSINKVIAGYSGDVPSVSSVLDQVKGIQLAMVTGQLQISFESPFPQDELLDPTYGSGYVTSNSVSGHTNVDANAGGVVMSNSQPYSAP
jgi:hypothetical protein